MASEPVAKTYAGPPPKAPMPEQPIASAMPPATPMPSAMPAAGETAPPGGIEAPQHGARPADATLEMKDYPGGRGGMNMAPMSARGPAALPPSRPGVPIGAQPAASEMPAGHP